MRFRPIALVGTLSLVLLGLASAPALASQQLGDRDVSFLSLKVDTSGTALATHRTSAGAVRHVYVWGAINANAPSTDVPQVQFRFDYTGGLKRDGRQTWKTFCKPDSLKRGLEGARPMPMGVP